MNSPTPLDVDRAVRDRYGAAAQAQEAALCCPVDYDPRYPEGHPRRGPRARLRLRRPLPLRTPGRHVLDLGSGGGKICFIASQLVGPEGRVIGVDMNDEMLELARRRGARGGQPRIGYANVEFRRGRDPGPVDSTIDLGSTPGSPNIPVRSMRRICAALETETERLA